MDTPRAVCEMEFSLSLFLLAHVRRFFEPWPTRAPRTAGTFAATRGLEFAGSDVGADGRVLRFVQFTVAVRVVRRDDFGRWSSQAATFAEWSRTGAARRRSDLARLHILAQDGPLDVVEFAVSVLVINLQYLGAMGLTRRALLLHRLAARARFFRGFLILSRRTARQERGTGYQQSCFVYRIHRCE